MLATLRQRLFLSHLLPVLVVTPLLSLAILYLLESQLLLPGLTTGLDHEAKLIARLTAQQPAIWQDPAEAQAFLAALQPDVTAQITLLDPNGKVIASARSLGKQQAPETANRNPYSWSASVQQPVLNSAQQAVGYIRLSQPLASLNGWFLNIRYLLLALFGMGLLLAAGLALLLATSLQGPMAQLTSTANQLTKGRQAPPLPEQGPVEFRRLAQALNILAQCRESLDKVEELPASTEGSLQSPHIAIDSLQSACPDTSNPGQERLLADMAKKPGGSLSSTLRS